MEKEKIRYYETEQDDFTNNENLKVKVITDSNSGLTQNDAEKYGISVLPMPFTIDGEEFFEEISISQEEFYEKLRHSVFACA